MSRTSADYTRCPDCKRRTVLFHFGRNGEDYLECFRCRWSCFRWPEGTQEEEWLRPWRELNPEQEAA